MSVLNEMFASEVKSICEYILGSEKDSWLDESDPQVLDSHVYKKALVVMSILGEQDIEPYDAERLLKTDCKDGVMIGNEQEGWTEIDEEDWTEEDCTQWEKCQLWII